MKAKIILLMITAAVLIGTVGIAARPRSPQSQAEMNADAARELRSAESQMEEILSTLTAKGKGHPDALAKFRIDKVLDGPAPTHLRYVRQ